MTSKPKCLLVGGLVGMGFDATGRFLLTVSHSGRGVFAVETWERVARDAGVAYPENGTAQGIGPLAGSTIPVNERVGEVDIISMRSPDGRFELLGESSGITVREVRG